MQVKVFLVEDHEIVRQGLKALLSNDNEINVIGEASNGAEALEKLPGQMPDVILMDMNMPVMNGLECTEAVKNIYPEVKVAVLSMLDHESYLFNMLEAGAKGYILKNASKEELIFAIKKIALDGIYISPEFTLGIMNKYKMQMNKGSQAAPAIELTEREKDVLDLIASGLTNVEMANKLFTSVRTIETRRKKLLEKTGTTNTATLIRYSAMAGLIK